MQLKGNDIATSPMLNTNPATTVRSKASSNKRTLRFVFDGASTNMSRMIMRPGKHDLEGFPEFCSPHLQKGYPLPLAEKNSGSHIVRGGKYVMSSTPSRSTNSMGSTAIMTSVSGFLNR